LIIRTSLFVAMFAIAEVGGAQSLPPGPLPEAGQSTIGYSSVQAALDALRAKPGVNISVREGWTIVNDPEGAVWSFTPDGNHAHPAVAKRSLIRKDGAVFMEMNVHCEAGKVACDDFVRQFHELNERLRQDMQRGKAPHESRG
jgi:hypothetical protein